MHGFDTRNISLGQIEVFVKAAEYLNFTKTGAALYIGESTVSKNVRSLETMLGIQLFIREKKTLRLTPAGRVLYEKWKSIVNSIEEGIVESHITQTGFQSSLTVVGLDSYKPETLILPVINHFKEKYPKYSINVETMPAETVRQKLIKGEADVAFTVLYDIEQLGSENFSAKMLIESPHVAMMLPENPLSRRKKIRIEDLKQSNFISISPINTPSYSTAIDELCREHGFHPNIVYYTQNANSLSFNLVTSNDVFICDRFYKDYGNPGLKAVPIEGTKSGIVLGYRNNNSNEALKCFLKETSDYVLNNY
ncbi:MAG: LysR family transcriptional regulator [Lachnospiraceae bacterium]|nr:LysR family transcriptional regulator [Lachnospiraceae bacterium]